MWLRQDCEVHTMLIEQKRTAGAPNLPPKGDARLLMLALQGSMDTIAVLSRLILMRYASNMGIFRLTSSPLHVPNRSPYQCELGT